MKIFLNDAIATMITTLGVVKWNGSIATHQNVTKTMVKTLWAPKTLDLMVGLIL